MSRPKKFTSSATSRGTNAFHSGYSNGHRNGAGALYPVSNWQKPPVVIKNPKIQEVHSQEMVREYKPPEYQLPVSKRKPGLDFSYEQTSTRVVEPEMERESSNSQVDLATLREIVADSVSTELQQAISSLKKELRDSIAQLETSRTRENEKHPSSMPTDNFHNQRTARTLSPSSPREHPHSYIKPSHEMIRSHDSSRPHIQTNIPQQSSMGGSDRALESKIGLLEKELLAAYKREKDLEEKVNSIGSQVQNGKTDLDNALSAMKKNVESTPTPENKDPFANLTQELDQVIKAVNQLESSPPPAIKESKETVEKKDETPVAQEETPVKSEDKKDKKTDKVEKKDGDKEIKKAKKVWFKNKLFIVVAVFLVIVGIAGFFLFRGGSSEVDESLIQNYLPEGAQGTVGAEDSEETPVETEGEEVSDAEGEVQGAQTSDTPEDRMAAAHADISYGETRWETHNDPGFGIMFDYPINASSLIRTDLSITVIRRTGYIFKVQRVETALELDEYWKQIKARNLRYKVQETTFRDHPALFLELEDITEYPGDRYLVKLNDWVYDVWYATASKNLDDDDAKRVDVMLNSFKFIEASA